MRGNRCLSLSFSLNTYYKKFNFPFSAHGGETLINAYLVTNQGGVDFLKKEAVSFQPWEKGKRLEREQ